MYSLDVLMKPADHGYIECNFCNGLGSLDMIKLSHIICSVCDGSGILKIKSKSDNKSKRNKLSIEANKKELFVV